MKNRIPKILIVLAIAGLLGSGAALAGNGQGTGDCDGDGVCTNEGTGAGDGNRMQRRGSPADRVAAMANRLGPTLDQQIRALELFDAQKQEWQQTRARMFEDYSEEICAQRELHREEFRALLTPDQLALHEQMQARRGQRGGHGGFECPADDTGN